MTEPLPSLMDRRQIMVELGVTKHVADHIISWCAKRNLVAPDGVRKVYVFRDDVAAWLEEHRRSAA